MYRLLLLLLCLSPTACAGKLKNVTPTMGGPGIPDRQPPPQFTHEGFKTKDGNYRSAYLYVPPGHSKSSEPLPVVFAMHGGKGNSGLKMIRRFMKATKTRPAIYVFPNGFNADRDIPGWTAHGRDGDPLRDVKFLTELATQVQSRHNGDPKRTYATGFSNGGTMTWYLTCFASDTFTATAVVGKPVPKLMVPHCPAERTKVPTIYIHGDQDPNGLEGQDSPYNHSLIASRKLWAKQLGCDPTPEIQTTGIATRHTFKGCAAPFDMITLAGVEHKWVDAVTTNVLDWFQIDHQYGSRR